MWCLSKSFPLLLLHKVSVEWCCSTEWVEAHPCEEPRNCEQEQRPAPPESYSLHNRVCVELPPWKLEPHVERFYHSCGSHVLLQWGEMLLFGLIGLIFLAARPCCFTTSWSLTQTLCWLTGLASFRRAVSVQEVCKQAGQRKRRLQLRAWSIMCDYQCSGVTCAMSCVTCRKVL